MFPSKTIRLNSGFEMPTIGLGTCSDQPGLVEEAVKLAIDYGYRHFDCAWIYGNEKKVGNALKEKISSRAVDRKELFITGKLWNNFHAKAAVVPKLQESLKSLNLEYLDLFLIHWPMGFKENGPYWPTDDADRQAAYSDVDYLETWQGMEEACTLGLAKSIGVSNFSAKQIDRLLNNSTIKPVVNQVECNPNVNQKKLIEFCKERGIVVVGYSPLGRSDFVGRADFPEPTILDQKVVDIGKKYNKTPAQVVLNYLVNNLGVAAIPKSVTPSRIKENFEIYNFVLDPEDVAYLDSCNKNQRVFPCKEFKDHKYYSFND